MLQHRLPMMLPAASYSRHAPVELNVSEVSQVSASTASSAYVEVSAMTLRSSRVTRWSAAASIDGGSSVGGRIAVQQCSTRPLLYAASPTAPATAVEDAEVPLITLMPTTSDFDGRYTHVSNPQLHHSAANTGEPISVLYACPSYIRHGTGDTEPTTPTALSFSINSEIASTPLGTTTGAAVGGGVAFGGRRSRKTGSGSPATASSRELRFPTSRSRDAADDQDGGDASVTREEAYEPPRFLSLERLLYTGVVVGFVIRSFVVGVPFFSSHISTLRRGVGAPDRVLAALMPSYVVGYDGGLDLQWLSFMRSFPKLMVLALALAAATRFVRAITPPQRATGVAVVEAGGGAGRPSTTTQPLARTQLAYARLTTPAQMQPLAILYAVVGFFFVAVVHGPHFFLPLAIIAANYAVFSRLQRWCPYWVFMAAMWTTHVVLLYVIEVKEGFESSYWLQYFFTTDPKLAAKVLGYSVNPLWGTNLRWYVAFRMTTLRLIAFNYDLWEATHGAARARERAVEKHDTTCVECAQLREQNSAAAAALPAEASRCYKFRTEHARDLADYGFVNYVAYVLFPPLYLAGPMSSFNAFVSYMRVPSTAMPPRKMAVYAGRTAGLLAAVYLLLHLWFIVAISEQGDLLRAAGVELQSYILYYYLAYLWLKFSFIWKTSRLFAMFSGIEVPEDMRRCFSDTYTVRDFWRDWHASFNLWIVRYMYIPLGGRGRVALSLLPIFLFIAVWHDPALHLIKWALCIALMFVAELLVSGCFGVVSRAFSREMAAASQTVGSRGRESRPWPALALARVAQWSDRHLSRRTCCALHRQLCSIGGFFSTFGLIFANIIGFCVQNATAGVTDASTMDAFVVAALQGASVVFYIGLFCALYSSACIGLCTRWWEAIELRALRRRYQLKQV